MIPLFLGVTIANLLLLCAVFGLGLFAVADGRPMGLYTYHIGLALGAGMMTLVANIGTYMYFMGTTRWLEAAAAKAGLDVSTFVATPLKRKSRVFSLMMASVGSVMLTMFAGAAADPTVRPWFGGEVHLAIAALAIVVNAVCALAEIRLIEAQSALVIDAAARAGSACSSA